MLLKGCLVVLSHIAHPLCGVLLRKTPDADNMKVGEEAKAVFKKQSPENGELEPNNTQENGPLKKESIHTTPPSARKELELNGQNEDMKQPQCDSGQAEAVQHSLQPTAEWEVFNETIEAPEEGARAPDKEEIPDGISKKVKSVCPEKPPLTETTTTAEDAANPEEEDGSKVTSDEAVREPSGEISANNPVLSVPNSQVDKAACQVFPGSVDSQEINKEAPSW